MTDSYTYTTNDNGLYTVTRVRYGQGHRYHVDFADGRTVDPMPSVTTVIGRVVPKPGLVGWMQKLMDEKYREVLADTSGRNFIRGYNASGSLDGVEAIIEEISAKALAAASRTDARDEGTDLHAAIAGSFEGAVTPERWNREVIMLNEWLADNGMVIEKVEIPVVDFGLAVGGTFDILARTTYGDSKPVLIDIKRAKHIYPEHWLQLGAYAQMIEQRFGEPVAAAFILQFTEDDDGPHLIAHHVIDLDKSQEEWRALDRYTLAHPLENAKKLFTEIGSA